MYRMAGLLVSLPGCARLQGAQIPLFVERFTPMGKITHLLKSPTKLRSRPHN